MTNHATRRNLLRMGLTVPLAALAAGCAQPERRLNFLARQGLSTAGFTPRNGPHRFCVLGDSIAQGLDSSDNNGFRGHLARWTWVNGEHHDFQFVGSQASTGDSPAGPLVHEGHGGWDCLQLYDFVQRGGLNYSPDLVVLVAGANDLDDGISAGEVVARLTRLTTAVLAYAQAVIVCKQMPMSTYNNHQLTLNAGLAGDVNALLEQDLPAVSPGRVFLAQTCPPAIGQADINAYGVHPTNTGYRKMGGQILETLGRYYGRSLNPVDVMR